MDNGEIQPRRQSTIRPFLWVTLAAFLVGFVPMWLSARTTRQERDTAQQSLRFAGIENSLAAAAIQARRGDYEPARASASTFYTRLSDELEREPSLFTGEESGKLKPLLSERDQTITLLARSDPAAADRLADVYVAYRQVAGTKFGVAP